jgi:hypothetical protein
VTLRGAKAGLSRLGQLPGLTLALALSLSGTSTGCGGSDGDTLPSGYHAVAASNLTVMPRTTVGDPTDPTAQVRAFNGIDGAPGAIHPELGDLIGAYWNRPPGSTERDGSHVEIVRVGPDVVCAAALDGIFPAFGNDTLNPMAYDLEGLVERLESVLDTQSAALWWQASVIVDRPCGDQPLDASSLQRWASIAAGAVGRLTAPTNEARVPLKYAEFLDAPVAALGFEADDLDAVFAAFETFARGVRALAVPVDRPPVAIVGLGFEVTSLASLADDAAEVAPVRDFITFIASNDVPIDVLSIRTRTEHPYEVRTIAAQVRALLDGAGLTEVALAITGLRPASRPEFADEDLINAHLGAFEAAARIYLQDVDILTVLSGRGPVGFRDGAAHTDATLESLAANGLVLGSDFFTETGDPRPAYMTRFPFRQIDGDTRLVVAAGADQEGMAILASRPDGNTRILDVLIVNANVHTGSASMTWSLTVPGLVPPQVRRVDFRLSILDHRNTTLGSFFFSELGTIEPHPQTGDVRLSRVLPIPGVHYLQLEIPAPSAP